MKKSLLYFVFASLFMFYTGFAFGQCTPDANVIDPDGTGRMDPDTIQAWEGEQLNLTVTIIAPLTGDVGGGTITLHHITVKSLTDKPAWLSYACNPSNCEFAAGIKNCVLVTSAGVVPTGGPEFTSITVLVDVYALILGVPVQVATDYNSGMPLVVWVHPAGWNVAEFEYKGFGIMPAQPNPFNSTTKLGCYTETPQTVSLRVFDMVGKEVYTEKANTNAGENYFTFTGSDLNDGIYFYSVIDEQNRTITKKFIKSK